MRSGDRRLSAQKWYGLKPAAKRVLAVPGASQIAQKLGRKAWGGRKAARLPVPMTVNSVTTSVAGTHFLMANPSRCVVAKELYWGQGKRVFPADQFALEVFAKLATSSSVILDIGSYSGIFTLLAAKVAPRAAIHAFEIVPEAYLLLARNLVLNDLIRLNVVPHLYGIGRSGSVVIPRGEGGSAVPDFLSIDMKFEGGVTIPVVSLVDVIKEISFDSGPVLIKIDVEGTEAEVLASADSWLGTTRPSILCELLDDRAKPEIIHKLLKQYNYHYFSVRSDCLLELSSLSPHGIYRDWLLTPYTSSQLKASGIEVASVD